MSAEKELLIGFIEEYEKARDDFERINTAEKFKKQIEDQLNFNKPKVYEFILSDDMTSKLVKIEHFDTEIKPRGQNFDKFTEEEIKRFPSHVKAYIKKGRFIQKEVKQ